MPLSTRVKTEKYVKFLICVASLPCTISPSLTYSILGGGLPSIEQVRLTISFESMVKVNESGVR